jgi:hypothetical protein
MAVTRDRCNNFIDIFAKKMAKKLAILIRKSLTMHKFDHIANFFGKIVENRRKMLS